MHVAGGGYVVICEGLKIAHAERGEVGERFVEKMVSLGRREEVPRPRPALPLLRLLSSTRECVTNRSYQEIEQKVHSDP